MLPIENEVRVNKVWRKSYRNPEVPASVSVGVYNWPNQYHVEMVMWAVDARETLRMDMKPEVARSIAADLIKYADRADKYQLENPR